MGTIMSIDAMEKATEAILDSIGICPEEYAVFSIMILGMSVGAIALYGIIMRIKCRNLSCDKIDKTISKITKTYIAIEKIRDDIKTIAGNQKIDHALLSVSAQKVEEDIDKIKMLVGQLNGIMMGVNSNGPRKRIEYDGE